MIIMIYPCSASISTLDLTSMLVLNNLAKLDYGSVEIVNLMSKTDANVNHDLSLINTSDNNEQILTSAQNADTDIIIAWGKAGEGNKKVSARINAVLKLLLPFKDRIFAIADSRGVTGHPLMPSLRSRWQLVPFDFPELKNETTDKSESDSKKKGKKAQKQAQTDNPAEPQEQKNDENDNAETA